MSEAIISRRGYGPDGKPKLYTQTFTGNVNFTFPNTLKSQVNVLLFSGGASGAYGGGGGG